MTKDGEDEREGRKEGRREGRTEEREGKKIGMGFVVSGESLRLRDQWLQTPKRLSSKVTLFEREEYTLSQDHV